VEVIKNLAEKRLKETELMAKTQMEAYKVLSFFILFLMIAGVFFSIYNVRSIIKDLPPQENKSINKTDALER
jgi:hypothetical protein